MEAPEQGYGDGRAMIFRMFLVPIREGLVLGGLRGL